LAVSITTKPNLKIHSQYPSVVPAFWRLRQKDGKLEASLVHMERPCFKETKQNKAK
jgi:hypothetical protein